MCHLHRPMNLFAVVFLAGLLLVACATPADLPASTSEQPGQGWQSTSPEAQGMDSTVLVEMLEAIQKKHLRLHSLLIVRNGVLVLEAYWDPYGPEEPHTTQSITKSVVGTLVGIAIDQGAITSVDQKLVDFFPERSIQNLDEQKESITLRHLLSMTPGLTCQDQSSAAQGMYRAEDWIQYLLDLPVSDAPGTRWIYCSGAAHLLSAILQDATGMDARTYANTYLFGPLGNPAVTDAEWSLDPKGVNDGIAGLYLRPRDVAKYGLLYLNEGLWNGQQIVPAQWVQESTREQAYIGEDDYVGGLDRRFGYFWSIFPDLQYYGYLGMAGQELYVLPEQEMVVVFSGALPVGKEALLLNLVNDYIVPAARSKEALPPNPQADSRLENLVQAAAGSEQPVPALHQIALQVSGKTYQLEQNALGWRDMTFLFETGSDQAILRMSGSPDLVIGLDNRYRMTETPDSRPVGLRGRWLSDSEFNLEYLILGEFTESTARIQFTTDQITLAIKSLNYSGSPIVLHGSAGR